MNDLYPNSRTRESRPRSGGKVLRARSHHCAPTVPLVRSCGARRFGRTKPEREISEILGVRGGRLIPAVEQRDGSPMLVKGMTRYEVRETGLVVLMIVVALLVALIWAPRLPST